MGEYKGVTIDANPTGWYSCLNPDPHWRAFASTYLKADTLEGLKAMIDTALEAAQGERYFAWAEDRERQEAEETRPTNEWDCERCGAKCQRWRGQSDVSCVCGAQYNASGQRLRDDWRGNPSNYDDEIGDLEGYEIQQLRNEEF